MEYQIGDKVRIREDLKAFKTYNGTCAVVGMLKYGGEIAVITKQRSINQYHLGIDGGEYFWTPKMFDQNYKPESENYMKTSEFKNELEKLGYTFEDECVKNEQNLMAAWISKLYVNKIDSAYVCILSPKLFNLIYKYAATPIAEREDEDDSIIYTGAELIRTAVDDWADFSEGDEKLMDWFPELADLLPKKKYKTDPQLMCIEEVEK